MIEGVTEDVGVGLTIKELVGVIVFVGVTDGLTVILGVIV